MVGRSLQGNEVGIAQAKTALTSKGWSRQQLAKRIVLKEDNQTTTGVSIQTINKFFKGDTVDRKFFVAICEALELEWTEITGLSRSSYHASDTEQKSDVLPDENFWDADLSSVNGLILIYTALLAREKVVAVDLKELCNQLYCNDYDYSNGFLVALRAAKLVYFRSDFKTFWRFDYIHPALKKDIKGDLKRRIKQAIIDEELSAGDASPFEGDIRVVEDYIEELVKEGKRDLA